MPHLLELVVGGYAEATLLPGEDAARFQRARRALFHNYRPQTQDGEATDA